jgi:hypothetical protein
MYSPKINEKHIPTLYHLGKKIKKPMTKLVNEAITQYLEREHGIQSNLTVADSKSLQSRLI